MKLKRQSKIRSTLRFYKQNFNYSEPASILLDGNFLKLSSDIGMDLQLQFRKFFLKPPQFFTTSCVAAELRQLNFE